MENTLYLMISCLRQGQKVGPDILFILSLKLRVWRYHQSGIACQNIIIRVFRQDYRIKRIYIV